MKAMRRPYRSFDWSLRSCGLHGHITYRPTEEALSERLTATTASGEAWRCLRCGDFVLGKPHGSGPADEAPIILRGRALRDALILRFLALERGIRGLLLLALAYGIYKFDGAKDTLQRTVDTYLPLLKPAADHMHVNLAHSGPVRFIERVTSYGHETLMWAAVGVFAYGCLQLTEAVGLWMLKRWGEYVAVVGTSLFLPLEIYEISEKFTWLKLGALLLNLAAVAYLLWTKRLFGLRGGHTAFEAERHSESLLEVEQAALVASHAKRIRRGRRALQQRSDSGDDVDNVLGGGTPPLHEEVGDEGEGIHAETAEDENQVDRGGDGAI